MAYLSSKVIKRLLSPAFLIKCGFFALFVGFFLFGGVSIFGGQGVHKAEAATYSCVSVNGATDWNLAASWTGCNSTYPGNINNSGNTINVTFQTAASQTLTLSGALTYPITAITFPTTGAFAKNVVLNGFNMEVTGTTTMSRPATSGTNTLTVGTAQFKTGALTWTATTTTRNAVITASTGTIWVTGLMTMGTCTTGCQITFSDAGLLKFDGTFSGTALTLTPSTSTVEYTGSTPVIQAFTYYNLTHSGSGATTGAAAGTITIKKDLTLTGGGSYNFSARPVTISGTNAQSIAGYTTTGLTSMTKTSNTATFTGNVNGGALTINGNGGTLDLGAGFTHTFTGAWTRTVGTVTGNTSTLKIGGSVTNTAGTYTATTGNTVEYTGGAQTIATVSYYNLIFSGAGTKTVTSVTTVNNDFTASAGTATMVFTTVGNNFTVSGGTITLGASTLVITGNLTVSSGTLTMSNTTATTVSGTTTVSGGTLNVTGSTSAKKFTGLITVSSGTLSGSSTTIQIEGGITQNSSGTVSITGTTTFQTTAAQALNGTIGLAATTVGTGVTLTNSGTTTVSGTLTLTGNWTQGSSSNLNLSGATPFSGAGTFDASTNANTVNYSGAAQTVKVVAYSSLTLSGSGAKTVTSVTTVSANFSMSGSATATTVITTIGGNASTAGTAAWTLGASLTISGTLTVGDAASASTLITGNFTLGVSSTTTVADLSTMSHRGNAALSFVDMAINGTVSNTTAGSGTITATGNITGSGTVTLNNVTAAGTFIQRIAADKTFGSSSGSNTWSFYHLKFENSNGATHTVTPNAGTGTVQVDGTLTIGNASDGAVTAFDNNTASDRIFDLNGTGANKSINVTSNGSFTASNSASFTVADDFTNSGTFTAPTNSTVTFDTTATAVIAGATTFYNITSTTATKIIQFTAGQTFTTNGLLTFTSVTLTSTTGSSSWTINHQGTESITSTTISWSACHGSSTEITALTASSNTDGGNNGTCWTFVSGITVAGTVYQTDGSTVDGAGYTIKASVNGGTATSSTTNGSGVFSFNTSTIPTASDFITLWLDTNGGNRGTLVFKYGASCTSYTDCTGLTIVRDQIRLANFNSGSIANTDLASCDNDSGAGCADTDIGFTANSGVLTTTWATNKLTITSTATYTPGGNVSVQSMDVAGTFNAGSNTITISGSGTVTDWCNDTSGITCESTNWVYRKKITFDNSASSGALTNFPVLVQLTSSNIDFAHVAANGADLRFVDPTDNTTVLDHEIEKWDEAGTSYIWVRVPSLAANNTDYVWLYYGYGAASDGQNATGVWDSNHVGVWHMSETPTASLVDSTSNPNDANTSVLSSGDQVTGKIGGAINFSSAGDYASVTDDASLNLGTAFTIDFWQNSTNTTANAEIMGKWYDNNNFTDYEWYVYGANSTDELGIQIETNGNPFSTECIAETSNANLANSTWNHIVITMNASGIIFYVNGSAVSSSTVSGTCSGLTVFNGTYELDLGGVEHGLATTVQKNDEIRISNSARSADWVEAEYLFETDNSKYTYGSEEGQTVAPPFSVTGTFNADTSTVDFTATTATTIPAFTYYNLGVKPGANSITHTLASGTFTIGGSATFGNGTNTGVVIDVDTNDAVLDIAGAVTIAASSTLSASASSAFTIGGNWTNSGTFTHNSGTVTFDGTGSANTINAGSSSFYNITFNGSGGEWSPLTNTLTIAGDLVVTAGILNNDDGSADVTVNGDVKCLTTCGTLTFTAGTFTQSVATDKAFGTDVAGSTAWSFNNLTFTGTSDTVTTSVTGSGTVTITGSLTISSNTTLDAGSRTWVLSGTGTPLVVSGTFTPNTSIFQYTNGTGSTVTATTFSNLTLGGTGTYTLPASSWTVNGNVTVTSGATVTKGAGTITFSGSADTKTITDNNGTKQDLGTISIGNGSLAKVINLGSSVKITTVTITAGATLSLNGSNTLTLTKTSTAPLVISGTFTPSAGTVEYAPASSSTINIAATTYHHVTFNSSSSTFRLAGGDITTDNGGNVTITAGTLDTVLGTNSGVSVGGNWSNSDTFTARGGTVTFTATSGTKTIDNNASSFYNVVINGSGGTFQVTSNAMTISNDLSMTAGTLSGTQNVTVNGGDVYGDAGVINMTGGTFLLDGAGNFGNDNDFGWSFNNLTFGDGTGTTTTTTVGSADDGVITVTGVLTIAANQTLSDPIGKPIVLSGTGTPLVRSGTLNISAPLSSFLYTSSSGVTALSSAAMTGSNAFSVIYIFGTGTFTAGVAIEAKNNLFISSGTLAMGANNLSVGDTLYNGSGNIFVASGQALTQTSSGTTTILGYEGGTNCIGSTGPSCSGTPGTITFGNLTLGNGANQFTSTLGGTTPTITVAGLLDITGDAALNGGTGSTISLTGNGTVFTNSGTFTAGTSTVAFNSADTTGTTVPALTYYNLTLNRASNTFTGTNSTVVQNNFTITAGTFAAPAGNFTVGGNFTNTGTFTHNNGTVILDTVATSTVGGASTSFYNFTSTVPNKTIQFTNGNTFTFNGTLTLTGGAGTPINVYSDSNGVQWTFYLVGSASISYINVKDSACHGSSASVAASSNINNGGNNGSCWGFIQYSGGGSYTGDGGSGSSGADNQSGGGAGVTCGTASGTVTVSNGIVTAIVVVTGGGCYAAVPVAVICGGGGSGALLTAVLTNGVVTSVTVDNGGSGYGAPTMVFGNSPDGLGGGCPQSGGGGGGGGGGTP